LRDNALFTAFAPADHPRIAIAIVVENGGFGAAAAAPIVRKALDYYLLGKRPDSKDMPPAGKDDFIDIESAAALKAEAESVGGPKPGMETRGSKD
jgi:penicillin-binding protein 2